MKNKFLLIIYFLLFAALAWWSWILTAPNLVLTQWAPYWNWQQWLWQTFYSNRAFISWFYLVLVIALSVVFLLILVRQKFASRRSFFKALIFISLPLIFSFNALSNDVFNYLFNAKMVAVYHANPHQQVALDFAADDWVRFMHNTHTTAPYGYGWTAISLLPYTWSLGKFLPAWLSFRLLNFGLLLATFFIASNFIRRQQSKINYSQLTLFFFNPLVLIELLMNMHNDLWMMLPALWSLFLIYPAQKNHIFLRPKISHQIFSVLLFAFSCSIKYASLALVPFWLFLFFLPILSPFKKLLINKSQNIIQKLANFILTYFFDGCAIVMFLPLLTSRAQLFHPWYLIWSLVFLPFVKNKIIRTSLLILSFSSLLRYLPFLWENGYNDNTLFYQQLLSIVPCSLYLLSCYGHQVLSHVQKQKTF